MIGDHGLVGLDALFHQPGPDLGLIAGRVLVFSHESEVLLVKGIGDIGELVGVLAVGLVQGGFVAVQVVGGGSVPEAGVSEQEGVERGGPSALGELSFGAAQNLLHKVAHQSLIIFMKI